VHAEADVHDTPASTLASAPLGLGVDWMAQAVPFQRSASVTAAPLIVEEFPTAVHAEADVHDTAENAPVGASGLGVDTTDQAAAPDDGRGGCAWFGTPPGRCRQPGASGDLTGSCRPGTGGESGTQAAGPSRRWAGGRTAGGRAETEAAPAADVIASISPTPTTTATKAAGYLPSRH
jgi:hypothetical protein